MRWYILVFTLTLCLPTLATSPKVTIVLPDNGQNTFWQLVRDVTQESADDLQIDIEIINTAANRFASKVLVENMTKRANKPDYLVFFPFLGNTFAVFEQLELAKIHFITLEQSLDEDVGLPQGKFKYWLGQINYDNKQGGQLLFEALKQAHFKHNPNARLHLTGIGGDFDSVSLSRQSVLEQNMKKRSEKNLVVNQVFQMFWDPQRVSQYYPLMLERYPQTNGYWCASDIMALEVIKQEQESGTKPSVIGGFDWMPQALEKIKSGQMTASLGGHFLMGADALLKIIDHHNGIDRFRDLPILNSYEVIDSSNVNRYQPFLSQQKWRQSDFSKYLAINNQQPPKPLNIQNLIGDLERQGKQSKNAPQK